MHTGKHLAALMAALGLFTLAACGGGGGDGPKTMAQAQAETRTEADRNRVRTADPEKTLQGAKGAADSLPRFGSITQSTNRDANGVTTDRASAAFDGVGLTVTVTRADSSTLTLDTADAIIEADALPDRLSGIPGVARTIRSWGTVNIADRAATISGLSVTSASGDSSDWLAVGVWLHIAGQNLLSTASTVTSSDMGAFVDGPELRSPPENLPGTGTARYEGYAGGTFANRYGTGFAGIAPGSTGFGGFDAVATLTANFADNTISGCIGCKGDILSTGVFTDGTTGAQRTFTNTSSDAQLRLGTTPINSDGTFRTDDVTLFIPTELGVTEQGGSWGGRFSTIPVATGEPRLTAGTFGGRATYTDSSQLIYVGAFGAGKQ